MGTHLGSHAAALVLIRSAAIIRIHKNDVDIVMCGTSRVAIYRFAFTAIGIMRVLDEAFNRTTSPS